MGEDAGQRGLLAARMPLLRPGGGIVQLFTLEAGEIAAGQMKQIARQGDDLSAIAGQRFMDQVVVVLITLARIEAHHAVGVPAAVAHKAAQEIVTTRDTVDRAGLWRGKHPEEATTPGLYLPTVANNFISAMACGALGFHDAGLVFLGAGVFSWLSLEPVILQRLRSAGELPAALRTSLGIQLAPALVACSAWFSVNGGEADTFAKMLFGYGLLQLLFMLRLMPWYLSQPFNASFWSFSFGVSALATTGLHLGQSSPSGFFHALAVPLFIFTNVIIAMLLVRTFILLMQGKLLVRADKALLMQSEEK